MYCALSDCKVCEERKNSFRMLPYFLQYRTLYSGVFPGRPGERKRWSAFHIAVYLYFHFCDRCGDTVYRKEKGISNEIVVFVSEQAAVKGVTITNGSKVEPLVLLKHFGPNCPDVPQMTEE